MATTKKHAAANPRRLKRGDKVAVPWGLDEIVGEVEEVYGPPARKYVVVRVPTHGPAGEILHEENISFPEDSLRLAAAA
jgi:rRNA processing protein Gar1